MNEKIYNLLKIIIILVIIVLALIFKFIPEYKASKGSSDTYINTDTYESIVEIKINNQLDFILIIGNSKITNILFLEKTSLCLYNQNIEQMSIPKGISKIIEELIGNNYLQTGSFITLTKYNEKYYDDVKKELEKIIKDMTLEVTYIENEMTIKEKANNLDLTGTSDESYLKSMELYSKELVRHQKNNVSSSNDNNPTNETLNKTTAKIYADTVYKKIKNYASANNVMTQEISSSALPINLIPADINGTIYPSSDSWYYIEDGKVYAYIIIAKNANNYKFCYKGTIENYKDGEC